MDTFLQLHPAVQITLIVAVTAAISFFIHCSTR